MKDCLVKKKLHKRLEIQEYYAEDCGTYKLIKGIKDYIDDDRLRYKTFKKLFIGDITNNDLNKIKEFFNDRKLNQPPVGMPLD